MSQGLNSAQPEATQPDAIDCWRCQHLLITHEPAAPYGCRLLGFKSRAIPSLQVLRIDGRPCEGFEPRPDHTSSSGLRHR